MLLRSLRVKNYRSLENVELDRLGEYNVLIGRNNSGKSSIFGAIIHVGRTITSGASSGDHLLTAKELARSLKIELTFAPSSQERQEFVAALFSNASGERQVRALNSPMFRQVSYVFSSPPDHPHLLHMRSLRILAEDNRSADVFQYEQDELSTNPVGKVANLRQIADAVPDTLAGKLLGVPRAQSQQDLRLPVDFVSQGTWFGDPAAAYSQKLLASYLGKAFFFNPFRHSGERLPSSESNKLDQNGGNLAQVLHTINSNDRNKFASIESFVHSALPDIGLLQTPLRGSETEVSFRAPESDYLVRLHDMGGGVEQLLMVATVLHTTDTSCPLFLEEPESHLHAGAQRFLIDQIVNSGRQVFLTTHSPTFVNVRQPRRIYLVTYSKRRTVVKGIGEADSLAETLQEIGSRNSDVLLSDSVLFVEGPADRDVFTAWSQVLGKSLEGHNITVLPMGGGEAVSRGARARSEVLEGISARSPVPHLFVVDRDERSLRELAHLEAALQNRLHILTARELENYMLSPRAIRAALLDKYRDNEPVRERVDGLSTETIQQVMERATEGLRSTVLLKRIRTEVGGLVGGFLAREMVVTLLPMTDSPDLAALLEDALSTRAASEIAKLSLEVIVQDERRRLEAEWTVPERRPLLAPGEEILDAVFREVGGKYEKPADTVRIARQMTGTEIPQEISDIIDRALALTITPVEGVGIGGNED